MDADVFQALSDPTRRLLLERLAAGEVRAGELAEGLPISQPAVSQHLKVLLEAGLVTRERRGRSRIYALVPERLRAVDDWVASFRVFWEDRLDALGRYLDEGEE